jgi:hypothetical protein
MGNVMGHEACKHRWFDLYIPYRQCYECGDTVPDQPNGNTIKPRKFALYAYPNGEIKAFIGDSFKLIEHGKDMPRPGFVCNVVERI